MNIEHQSAEKKIYIDIKRNYENNRRILIAT